MFKAIKIVLYSKSIYAHAQSKYFVGRCSIACLLEVIISVCVFSKIKFQTMPPILITI